MADAIGPGDFVECVPCRPGGLLTAGAVYCVGEVTPEGRCNCITEGIRPWAFPHPGVLLADGPNPHPSVARAWCCYEFRPIYRPKSSLIEALKVPAPSEPVPA